MAMVSFPYIQMPSLQCLSLFNKHPLLLSSPPQLFFLPYNKPISCVPLWLQPHGDCDGNQSCSLSSSSCIVYAVEKDSQQYEIDPDKAKEALKKLDQQLQDLSKKQVSPPKIRASDVKITRDEATKEEELEISGSFLTYTTIALFLFTIFYNILFIKVIKPSIDLPMPEPASATSSTTTIVKESPE